MSHLFPFRAICYQNPLVSDVRLLDSDLGPEWLAHGATQRGVRGVRPCGPVRVRVGVRARGEGPAGAAVDDAVRAACASESEPASARIVPLDTAILGFSALRICRGCSAAGARIALPAPAGSDSDGYHSWGGRRVARRVETRQKYLFSQGGARDRIKCVY